MYKSRRLRAVLIGGALGILWHSAAAAQHTSSPAVPAPGDTLASAPNPESSISHRESGRRRARRDRLDREEIERNQATLSDAFAIVNALRPTWLSVRRGSMMLPEGVKVYRDGVPMGGVDALRQLPTVSIERVEHLDGRVATTRFGTGHGSGAILVFTRS